MPKNIKIKMFPNHKENEINEYELKKHHHMIEMKSEEPKKKTMKDIFVMKKHKC